MCILMEIQLNRSVRNENSIKRFSIFPWINVDQLDWNATNAFELINILDENVIKNTFIAKKKNAPREWNNVIHRRTMQATIDPNKREKNERSVEKYDSRKIGIIKHSNKKKNERKTINPLWIWVNNTTLSFKYPIHIKHPCTKYKHQLFSLIQHTMMTIEMMALMSVKWEQKFQIRLCRLKESILYKLAEQSSTSFEMVFSQKL